MGRKYRARNLHQVPRVRNLGVKEEAEYDYIWRLSIVIKLMTLIVLSRLLLLVRQSEAISLEFLPTATTPRGFEDLTRGLRTGVEC